MHHFHAPLYAESGASMVEQMDEKNTLSERLKWLRKKRGFKSRVEAATAMDIKFGAYQRWEIGGNPSRKNIDKIAKYYRCSKSWLITGEGEAFLDIQEVCGPEGDINKGEFSDRGLGEMVKYGGSVDLKDKLIRSQEKLIAHLEKECNDLKTRLEAIKKRLSGLPNENIGKKVM